MDFIKGILDSRVRSFLITGILFHGEHSEAWRSNR
jgi:hypothetical protein